MGHFIANGDKTFEITVPTDLRGKWVTVTRTRITELFFSRRAGTSSLPASRPAEAPAQTPRYLTSDTSELSNAILVH